LSARAAGADAAARLGYGPPVSSRLVALPACAALAFGCGARVAVDLSPGSGGAASTTTVAAGGGGAGPVDAGPDALPPPTVAVYVNSGAALFAIDPVAQTFSEVGNFKGCDHVVDIAVDSAGQIFGTTTTGLFRIDAYDATCTPVGTSAQYPNSLAFTPAGTLDPYKEVLVGYLDTTYVRIDTDTGAVSAVGALNGGFTSSGDLIVLQYGLAYLTGKGQGCDDCLLQVNPTSGGLVQLLGDVGVGDVYGLAYKYGALYGFTKAGAVLLLDTTTGHGTPLALPGVPIGVTYWGAASSLDYVK
jgi:hypothetical protein